MSEEAITPITVRAPRPAWMEFLLHFCTFGLYTCCWFVLRTRELNRMGGSQFTPWLWFFVPIIPLAQLFALPKLLKALAVLEERDNLPSWRPYYNTAWITAVFLLTLAMDISNKFEVPAWIDFCFLLIWAAFFAVLQPRVNSVKTVGDGLTFSGSPKNYSLLEWLILIPLLPAVLFGVGYLAIAPLFDHLQTLDENTVYIDPQKNFRFEILGDGWSIAEKGTLSDGDAELELKGPLADMYFLVFAYGHDQTLDSLARWRIENAHEELNFSSCTEERVLTKSQQGVIAHILCHGKVLTDPAQMVVTLIETRNGVYEFYGYMTSPKFSYRKYETTFRNMAKGFEPL